jgi:hypothetical protein
MGTTDYGKKFYVDDLAELFGLPDFDGVADANQDGYLSEAYQAGYRNAQAEGLADEDAESFGFDAEMEASNELYLQWVGSVEFAAQQLLGHHGLELRELKSGGYKLEPEHSWRDAAAHFATTIGGVGYAWYNSTQEFLDSGPYTPRQAVISHLGYVRSYPEVYGTSSAVDLYHGAF